jgi:hypothetical protein
VSITANDHKAYMSTGAMLHAGMCFLRYDPIEGKSYWYQLHTKGVHKPIYSVSDVAVQQWRELEAEN